MSKRLHLRPVPTGEVIMFPITAANTPEAVMAQLTNVYNSMEILHGPYLARNFFVEAVASVAARTAYPVGRLAVQEAREDLTICFDQTLVELAQEAKANLLAPLAALLTFGAASWLLAGLGAAHMAGLA